jgi:hypothetical protein
MPRAFSFDVRRKRGRLATLRTIVTRVAVAAAFLSSALSAQSSPRGLWQLRYDPEKDHVQLNFEDYDERRGHGGMTGFSVRPSQLTGVTQSQLSSAEGPVRFQLIRDAGTFSFEGQIYRGRGNGAFNFSPNPRFADDLAKRGYSRPTAEQQFLLGLHDVGYSLLDELRSQGYNRPSVNDLVTMGMHGVRFDYVRGLGSLGYRVGSTDRLVQLRDHGVTPTFITGLASAGYAKLSIDRLQELRDHGVTPAYIAEMSTAGYGRLSVEDLLELRDHGVTPAYIAGLAKAGYSRLSSEELLNARDHGVTPDLAEGFRKLGYSRLSLRQLVQLRDHGVTVPFAERLRDREGSLSVEELIRRRDRGDRY